MKTLTAYQIRCQGLGLLPTIYASADLAEAAQPDAEAAERRAYGETGKDGDPRWARVVPVRFVASDDVPVLAPWPADEPAAAPPEPARGGENSAAPALDQPRIRATGTVRNPG